MQVPIKLGTIKPEALKILRNNQEECEIDVPKKTNRATFKLFELEALLEAIKASTNYKEDGDRKHSVCITFVREKVENSVLGYHANKNLAHKEMMENVTP